MLKSSILKGTDGSNVQGMTDHSGHRQRSWQVKWFHYHRNKYADMVRI